LKPPEMRGHANLAWNRAFANSADLPSVLGLAYYLAQIVSRGQCSPDLNPIEQVFAKLKTMLRKAYARSIAAVWHRIGTLLRYFTPTECGNYLRHAGYASC